MHDFNPAVAPQEHPPEHHVQLMIGKVASLYGITVQTLRHYDKIGLFRPDVINPETGYRYYSLQQLRQLEYILFLRRLEFSLPEIQETMEFFREGGDITQVLRQRSAKLRQQIENLEQLEKRMDALAALAPQDDLRLNEVGIQYFDQPRHLRFREIEPLAVSDPDFSLKLMDERKALLGSIPTIQTEYSMGAMVSAEAFRASGVLSYCAVMLDPGFYGSRPIEGMEAVPTGYYAVIRFRRAEVRPEDIYRKLLDFVGKHRFDYDDRILECSLDPSFSSISRLGELTELQLHLQMDP